MKRRRLKNLVRFLLKEHTVHSQHAVIADLLYVIDVEKRETHTVENTDEDGEDCTTSLSGDGARLLNGKQLGSTPRWCAKMVRSSSEGHGLQNREVGCDSLSDLEWPRRLLARLSGSQPEGARSIPAGVTNSRSSSGQGCLLFQSGDMGSSPIRETKSSGCSLLA